MCLLNQSFLHKYLSAKKKQESAYRFYPRKCCKCQWTHSVDRLYISRKPQSFVAPLLNDLTEAGSFPLLSTRPEIPEVSLHKCKNAMLLQTNLSLYLTRTLLFRLLKGHVIGCYTPIQPPEATEGTPFSMAELL